MNILFVIDQMDNMSSGVTVIANKLADELSKMGHTIYWIGIGDMARNKIECQEIKLNLLKDKIADKELKFAKPNIKEAEKIVRKVDLIHFFTPFKLSRKILKIAQKADVPCTAGFYIQPQTISNLINLEKSKIVNKLIFMYFKRFYNQIEHLHCPSNYIVNELEEHGFISNLHEISNGISDELHYLKLNKPSRFADKFIIATAGKYVKEKKQDIIIDAIAKSKYEKVIQLIAAGEGPEENVLRKKSYKLTNLPIFNWYAKEELYEILGYSDLYIHPSDFESEPITCMEAMALGRVPIIADSEETAAKQFAIDKKSLFKADNSTDLAKKIDFWIEHYSLKERVEQEYSMIMKKYKLSDSAEKMERMFKEAIKDFEDGQD